MIDFLTKYQWLLSIYIVFYFIITTKNEDLFCSNCENKQTQEICSKKDSCNIASSMVNNIGQFIRLRTIATIKNATKDDIQDNERDIDEDPREKFFFVETSQRNHLRKF